MDTILSLQFNIKRWIFITKSFVYLFNAVQIFEEIVADSWCMELQSTNNNDSLLVLQKHLFISDWGQLTNSTNFVDY